MGNGGIGVLWCRRGISVWLDRVSGIGGVGGVDVVVKSGVRGDS